MSWTPYDHEAEERRDSEWFADASVFDGPDPSEYEDRDEAILEMADQARKPHTISQNDALIGCVVVLVTILLAFMFSIWFGSTIIRWVL